jgi:hypothetical protein
MNKKYFLPILFILLFAINIPISKACDAYFCLGKCICIWPPAAKITNHIFTVSATEGGTASGGGTFAENTIVTATASANSGYRVGCWSGDTFYAPSRGAPASPCRSSLTVVLSGDKTVTANFVRQYKLTINGYPSGQGQISVSPYSTYNKFDTGTVVSLTATPWSNKYSFTGWSGDASGSANPLTVTMNADKSITANFVSLFPLDPLSPVISSIDHGYEITWSAPSPAPASYKIYKSTSSNFSSIIQTISTTELFFRDNRIQDPSSITATNPLYYKITSIANGFESAGNIVNTKLLPAVQYTINNITITGSGFISGATFSVALVAPGERYSCGTFAYVSSTEIAGSCTITQTPTGTYDLELTMVNNGQTSIATLPSGFQVTYPVPVSPSVTISNTDLSSGALTINSVAGDNLYTGANVNLVVKDSSGKVLAQQTCFFLGQYDYSAQKFSGGSCQINSEIANATGGDYSKIKIQIANDADSIPTSVTTPSFSCDSNSWTPSPPTVCSGVSFIQTNSCGASKSLTSIGTMSIIWTPDTSVYCPSTSYTQTSTNCNPQITSKTKIAGTKTCASGICQGSDCIVPACTSFTYSDWGACLNGQQTRTVTSTSPVGCGGGSPITSQYCCVPTWTPDPSTVSECTTLTQTNSCGGTRSAAGTDKCNSPKSCVNGTCCVKNPFGDNCWF